MKEERYLYNSYMCMRGFECAAYTRKVTMHRFDALPHLAPVCRLSSSWLRLHTALCEFQQREEELLKIEIKNVCVRLIQCV